MSWSACISSSRFAQVMHNLLLERLASALPGGTAMRMPCGDAQHKKLP